MKKSNNLPCSVRLLRLQKIYKSTGKFKNKNLARARNDKNLGEKLAPVKNFVYSTISSEVSGYIADRA